MKKQTAMRVGEIMEQVLHVQNMGRKLKEKQVISVFPKLVGPIIEQYITQLYVINEVLYVHLSSSVLRNDLIMTRQSLLQHIHNAIGEDVIKNIVFR